MDDDNELTETNAPNTFGERERFASPHLTGKTDEEFDEEEQDTIQKPKKKTKKPLSEAKKIALVKANEARKRKAAERKQAKKEALARQYLDEMAEKVERRSITPKKRSASSRYKHYASETESESESEEVMSGYRLKRKPRKKVVDAKRSKKPKKKVVYISESESESESEEERVYHRQPPQQQPEPFKLNFF